MNDPQLLRLTELLARNSAKEGLGDTVVPGLKIFRAESPSISLPVIYQPSLCILAQGAKRVFWSDNTYDFLPGKFLTVTLDLPLQSQIIEASPERPYLLMELALDASLIAELLPFTPWAGKSFASKSRSLFVGDIDAGTAFSIMRLAELMSAPQDIPVLADSLRREAMYRLLCGKHGQCVALLASRDSYLHRIGLAVQRIKENFRSSLSIPELATLVGMSTSSFHLHFKNITGVSPLQYQKTLRLMEARYLMSAKDIDATTSAYEVGYESPSQFSREYARMFGNPPARDIAQLHQAQG